MKKISISGIKTSSEMRNWVNQFRSQDRNTAEAMLAYLRFVSRDDFSEWVSSKLVELEQGDLTGIYAVRKHASSAKSIWNNQGATLPRPASTSGSEDFVQSLIGIVCRNSNGKLLDSPSLNLLRKHKVRRICLVDDSIGSGNRISTYLRLAFSNPTFMSWWSYGWIEIDILTFSRFWKAECRIISSIPGSSDSRRVRPVSSKISFRSKIVFDDDDFSGRWGEDYEKIVNVCNGVTCIKPKAKRTGYGNVMANVVFEHSIPNNLPAVFWSKSGGWIPLFPNRALPAWILKYLDSRAPINPAVVPQLVKTIVPLLRLVKAGYKQRRSIALRMQLDLVMVDRIISSAQEMGLMKGLRLTQSGSELLVNQNVTNYPKWNYNMYTPKSWRVD